ncbi:hypothetical protein [Psychromicrobium sp. YIM B11713]|uniref:hypothetical protein n=1 Tax=Psychromicrobium sp. YIM B11713 TaxID=3145233 RepID=UPI00374EA417
MKSIRYIYGAIFIAGVVSINIMDATPLWGRILYSAFLLVPLVINEYQIFKKSAMAKQEANLTNSVSDNVLHEYRESHRI